MYNDEHSFCIDFLITSTYIFKKKIGNIKMNCKLTFFRDFHQAVIISEF